MKLKLIFASIVVASSFFIPSVSANEIEKAIKKNPNFVVTKFKDPNSEKAVMRLNNKKIQYTKYDSEEYEKLSEEIKTTYKQSAFPMIFLEGKFIRNNEELNKYLSK